MSRTSSAVPSPRPAATRRRYDHRVRDVIRRARDPRVLPELAIPPSTVRSWIAREPPELVTSDRFGEDHAGLVVQVAQLEQQLRRLRCVARLLLVLLRALGVRAALRAHRLPEGRPRQRLLRAIEGARAELGLGRTLRLLRLSPARFHAWRRQAPLCEASANGACRRRHPQALTSAEVEAMRAMATDEAYRHMSLRALAMRAMRLGRVFASAGTWCRKVREHGWRRPRRRVYPAKPRVGVRASLPNAVWHMDVTVIRLLDGTRTYLHAIIDNFSRKILAWRLAGELLAGNTADLLREAAAGVAGGAEGVALMTDSGVENVNGEVAAALEETGIELILAQVHVVWSNSMIERFWTTLRHGWLYLNTLDTIEALRRHVAFFVTEYNEVMPHSAFAGQTPDEMYRGTGQDVPARIAAARAIAREQRLAANRAATCPACPTPPK